MMGRGGNRYFAALLTAQICALIRYVVLARLLGPEELGKVVIIVLAGQFFDLITDTASDRFLIQDPEGAKPEALRLVQLASLARGVLIALILFAAAGPIAQFAGAPDVARSLQLLAVVPLITGLTNYDYRVRQREHNFAPEAAVLITSEILGLCATAAAAIALQDHRAILVGLGVRAVAAVVTSHVVSRRPYGLGYPGRIAGRLWRFGTPLALNGFLIFLSTQGDRVIISRWLGLDELGRYSVLLLLVYSPTAIIMRFTASTFLPRVAGARGTRDDASRIADSLGSTCFLLALAIACGFTLITPIVLPLFFGPAFDQELLLVSLVGLLQAWRLMEVPPTTAALAFGTSGIVLGKNTIRMLAIPAALAGLALLGTIEGVVLGLLLAEVLANLYATVRTNDHARWPIRREMLRYILLGTLGLALVVRANTIAHSDLVGELVSSLCIIIIFASAVWHERSTFNRLRGLLNRSRLFGVEP